MSTRMISQIRHYHAPGQRERASDGYLGRLPSRRCLVRVGPVTSRSKESPLFVNERVAIYDEAGPSQSMAHLQFMNALIKLVRSRTTTGRFVSLDSGHPPCAVTLSMDRRTNDFHAKRRPLRDSLCARSHGAQTRPHLKHGPSRVLPDLHLEIA